MTEDEIVEAVARAICRQDNLDDGYGPSETLNRSIEQGMWRNYVTLARAAIPVLTPIIQREVVEKCAELALKPVPAQIRNADDNGWEYGFRMPTYREIYDAIRAEFPPTCAKNAQVAPDTED